MQRHRLIERLLFLPTLLSEDKLQTALAGKTVLITGASSGIGKEVAYRLADMSAHLILVARSEERLLEIQRVIAPQKAEVTILAIDLRNEAEQDQLLQYIHQLPGGLDIFINNAGHSIIRSIYQSLDRYHDFTRTMAINYFAPVRLLLSLIPLLEQTKGQIINVSTINVLMRPISHSSAYQSSKAAFHVWLQSAATELRMRGIAVTSIYLPLVKTPMILPTLAYKDLPAMTAEHAAQSICKTLYTKQQQVKPWWLIPLRWGLRYGQMSWLNRFSRKGNGGEK